VTAGDDLELALWLARRRALLDHARRADPVDLAAITAELAHAERVIAALAQTTGRTGEAEPPPTEPADVKQAPPVQDNEPVRGLGGQTVAVERSVPGAGHHGLVSVTGPVTFGNSRVLRDAAADLVKTGQPWLLVDLTGCTRLDRAGLAALVGVRHRVGSAGGCLHLVDRSGTARPKDPLPALPHPPGDGREAAGRAVPQDRSDQVV